MLVRLKKNYGYNMRGELCEIDDESVAWMLALKDPNGKPDPGCEVLSEADLEKLVKEPHRKALEARKAVLEKLALEQAAEGTPNEQAVIAMLARVLARTAHQVDKIEGKVEKPFEGRGARG